MKISTVENKEKKEWTLVIEGEKYQWSERFISGKQIRILGDIDDDVNIYLNKPGNQDELIKDDSKIDLSAHGVEHIIIKEEKHKVQIIVNGRNQDWSEKHITFDEVVKLAFPTDGENPNTIYTVLYKKGPRQNPDGSMVKGDRVKVKKGMVFNVSKTDKS